MSLTTRNRSHTNACSIRRSGSRRTCRTGPGVCTCCAASWPAAECRCTSSKRRKWSKVHPPSGLGQKRKSVTGMHAAPTACRSSRIGSLGCAHICSRGTGLATCTCFSSIACRCTRRMGCTERSSNRRRASRAQHTSPCPPTPCAVGCMATCANSQYLPRSARSPSCPP